MDTNGKSLSYIISKIEDSIYLDAMRGCTSSSISLRGNGLSHDDFDAIANHLSDIGFHICYCCGDDDFYAEVWWYIVCPLETRTHYLNMVGRYEEARKYVKYETPEVFLASIRGRRND